MAALSAPDEAESSSTSTITDRPLEKLDDETAVDIVTDTETPLQTTRAVTIATPQLSDGVTLVRRRCKPKEKVAADTVDSSQDQLEDKATTSEAMISPTVKVTTPVSFS